MRDKWVHSVLPPKARMDPTTSFRNDLRAVRTDLGFYVVRRIMNLNFHGSHNTHWRFIATWQIR
jgi:hypothetical protein